MINPTTIKSEKSEIDEFEHALKRDKTYKAYAFIQRKIAKNVQLLVENFDARFLDDVNADIGTLGNLIANLPLKSNVSFGLEEEEIKGLSEGLAELKSEFDNVTDKIDMASLRGIQFWAIAKSRTQSNENSSVDDELIADMHKKYAALQLQIADAVQNFQNGGLVNRTGLEMRRLQRLVDALPQQPDDAKGFSEEEILKLHKAILLIPSAKSSKAEIEDSDSDSDSENEVRSFKHA